MLQIADKSYMITVVVPCYRERDSILSVLEKIEQSVDHIVVVDDACPDKTGELVQAKCIDERVQVIVHEKNLGVGGATLSGYERAIELGADVIVKVDGDGQMDPKLIPNLVRPICNGTADYTKGNRFFRLEGIFAMPVSRIMGNLILSFASKLSSGYWSIFDPTNGFTAIHTKVAKNLPRKNLANDFFFESDMLYHLNVSRAVVADIPMQAIYGEETSSLKITRILVPFGLNHFRNLLRRIFYVYFLRDFSIASIELIFGMVLMIFGVIYGLINLYESFSTNIPAATGTIILAALPILIGSYLLISFLNFDVQNQPETPLHPHL